MSTVVPEIKSCNTDMNAFSDQLQTFLTMIKKETGVPGICLALNVAGQNVSANVGTLAIDNHVSMNSDARFQVGCITKLFTAMLAAEMIESGKLDPDEPIEQYLEELRGTDRGKDIVIRHLLSHTSGYRGLDITNPGVAYYYSWPKFLNFFNTTPQLFKPGSIFSYEHSEYAILGEIIERIAGRDINDLYREMIIEPLKLNAGSIKSDMHQKNICVGDHAFNPETWKFTKLKPIPYGDFWRASLSDMTMSLQDLLRIASNICGITAVPDGLSEGKMAFVQKQVIKLPRTYGSTRHEQIPSTFGIGCAAYRGWILGHNGSARGQTCGLRFDPRNKIALVVGMNAWQPFLRDSIINRVFGALRGQAIPQLPEKPFESSLNDLVGTYVGPQSKEIVVTNEGDQITCKLNISNAPSIKVIMQKDDRGILQVCSDTLHYSLGFFTEPDSGVNGMMLGLSAFRKQ